MKPLIFTILLLSFFCAQAQQDSFIVVKELKHTPIQNQGGTGTCWSFSATSFVESEIMRKGFSEIDLSEMYNVYHAYQSKVVNYLMFQGTASFSCGGQAHDVMDVVRESGIETFESLPGYQIDGKYRHHKLDSTMKAKVVELNALKKGNIDVSDVEPFTPILEEYIGKPQKKSEYEGKKYKPEELRDKFGINPDDYVEISSYSHHPFYSRFVLEVPDNWSHGLYYNVPIDELVEIMVYAIDNGYTFCWDGDTSERTFRHKNGIADVPEDIQGKVTQKMRQKTFYDRSTTDDHLMHVVGLSKNAKGKIGFYTKNSWGTTGNNLGGFINLTEDYVRLKTIAIFLHKDAIPGKIKEKLKI